MSFFVELIDDITDHVDRTRDRLIRETRHVQIVDRKSNTCCKSRILLFSVNVADLGRSLEKLPSEHWELVCPWTTEASQMLKLLCQVFL